MNNMKIRKALTEYKVKQWELAEMLGIGEYTMCRKMRHEIPDEEQERIISIIKENRG